MAEANFRFDSRSLLGLCALEHPFLASLDNISYNGIHVSALFGLFLLVQYACVKE